jgi:polysaccharide pyruvyl transferase WcaK-like protein
MSKTILVVGQYSKSNMGDELFKDAFWKILPNHNLIFTDCINLSHKNIDAIIFGGGSFLEFPIDGIDEKVFANLTLPIFYIGVGAETDIHPDHQALMKRAKLIALRSGSKFEVIKAFNPNTTIIPDLVYALYDPAFVVPKTTSSAKRILLLPNISCVPKYSDAAWKHNAWQHFKFEFAQVLDTLIDDGYAIDYMPMSTDTNNLDDCAMIEIRNLMHKGKLLSERYRYHSPDIKDIIRLFSQYGTVISQRFHGLVLAEMSHTPYLSIAHHDKLNQTPLNQGIFTSYYSCSKATLLKDFDTAKSKTPSSLPIDRHIFEQLKEKVAKHLE